MKVETGLFWEDEENPKATLQAIRKYWPDAEEYNAERALNELSGQRCIATGDSHLFRGSLNMARWLRNEFEFANALHWMPRLREYLFNPKYAFMDFATIIDCATQMGISDSGMFVRPVSGFKEFSGQVFFDVQKLKNEYNFATVNRNVEPYIICVAADGQQVFREHRCIFVDNKLVAAVPYLFKGEVLKEQQEQSPDKVKAFAEFIAKHDMFMNVFEYVIDIHESAEGKLTVMEVNAFQTASFYSAPLDTIYKAWHQSFSKES